MNKYISVAIDGPSGAGKSSIAKQVAKILQFIYVDTGALYRAIGYFALINSCNPKDSKSIIDLLNNIKIELKYIDNDQRVFINNQDVSDYIRTDDVSMAASDVAIIPEVRQFLLDLQRSFGLKYNVIMDGRDIGTNVLPNAQVKIYLTATPKERATRRWKQNIENGHSQSFEDVLADVIARDMQDINRSVSPLKQADDAILLDTSNYNFEESVQKVLEIINNIL